MSSAPPTPLMALFKRTGISGDMKRVADWVLSSCDGDPGAARIACCISCAAAGSLHCVNAPEEHRGFVPDPGCWIGDKDCFAFFVGSWGFGVDDQDRLTFRVCVRFKMQAGCADGISKVAVVIEQTDKDLSEGRPDAVRAT